MSNFSLEVPEHDIQSEIHFFQVFAKDPTVYIEEYISTFDLLFFIFSNNYLCPKLKIACLLKAAGNTGS